VVNAAHPSPYLRRNTQIHKLTRRKRGKYADGRNTGLTRGAEGMSRVLWETNERREASTLAVRHRGSAPPLLAYDTRPPPPVELGLHKIFVCLLWDCALVDYIISPQRLLYFAPLYFANNHKHDRAMYGFTPTPLLCARHHVILVMAISCKGQPTRAIHMCGEGRTPFAGTHKAHKHTTVKEQVCGRKKYRVDP